jgi:hypothetical protein
MGNKGEYFGGGNFNDDCWKRNPPPTKKYHIWCGHEPFDFDETRAILVEIKYDKNESAQYVAEREKTRGKGYYWIDEIDVYYR